MDCDCSEFGKILEGSTGHTASCNRQQRAAEREAAKPPKVRKPIAKKSDKMTVALTEYGKLRRQFLEANPMCAVYPNLRATTVHHSKGRATIELLLDTNFWVPASMEGHIWIENHPDEAKEKGFSLSRLATEH